MMTLIKLTTVNGKRFWVNPQYIASMVDDEGGGTAIYVANDSDPVIVKEPPETIIQKISIIK